MFKILNKLKSLTFIAIFCMAFFLSLGRHILQWLKGMAYKGQLSLKFLSELMVCLKRLEQSKGQNNFGIPLLDGQKAGN